MKYPSSFNDINLKCTNAFKVLDTLSREKSIIFEIYSKDFGELPNTLKIPSHF